MSFAVKLRQLLFCFISAAERIDWHWSSILRRVWTWWFLHRSFFPGLATQSRGNAGREYERTVKRSRKSEGRAGTAISTRPGQTNISPWCRF